MIKLNALMTYLIINNIMKLFLNFKIIIFLNNLKINKLRSHKIIWRKFITILVVEPMLAEANNI